MEDHDVPAGADLEQIKIVVNSLHLCLRFLLRYIEDTVDAETANAAWSALLENLESGNIDIAIFEDRKTFDFVTSIISALPVRDERSAQAEAQRLQH